MTTETKSRQRLVLILAAAFFCRMALIVGFKSYAYARSWEYETLANNLLAGHGYSYPFLKTTYWSFNTPLFGYLCAGVYAVTNHSHFAILTIQSLFSLALALTVYAIARMVFSESVGLLASALVAFHPGLMYYDVFNLLPLSIDAFLIAVITFLVLKQKDRPKVKQMLSLGGLIGVATLSRGISGVLLPLVVIYIFLFAKRLKLKDRFKLTICVTAAVFLLLSPWLIRNYLIHRQFVFTSTIGENFWRGNNEHASGTSTDARKVTILQLWPRDFRDKVFAMTEMQQKRFFEAEAFRFIKNNPLQVMKLYLRKIYYFWWFSPQSGILYPGKYLAAYKIFYMILIIFSTAGLVFALTSSKRDIVQSSLILISVPILFCLAQSFFYVEGRHRWLVESMIIIFFCYGVTRCWTMLGGKLRLRSAKSH